DSEDLPLNVSREILQQNRILAAIKTSSVKKLLSEFKRISETDRAKYEQFIGEYNRPLKEGLYGDYAHREELSELVRFKTTFEAAPTKDADGNEKPSSKWTSLAEYASRMKPDQKAIYYITGGDEKTLRQSPHLEAYRAKGLEVLIMDDEIDDIVIPSLGKYKDWDLKAANRAGSDDELATGDEKKAAEEKEKEFGPVVERIKKSLGDSVKDVRLSKRLADSPSCIVVDENDPSLQMERMMKAMGQSGLAEVKPILEINADHELVKRIQASSDDAYVADVSAVLLDQALLVEGGELKDPADFVKRLNRLLAR
ncbi:MAG TPA: molecular chaperone HtpG, partial [Treponemataceae bacterium]|nr:molecular chaperone HtpG [Treponemataceae bacterium]